MSAGGINHLLPRWHYCVRHGQAFRDFRVHAECPVRFATQLEILQHHTDRARDEVLDERWRYYNDAEYHAWVHLAWYTCRFWHWLIGSISE